jgi:hypothetical protein
MVKLCSVGSAELDQMVLRHADCYLDANSGESEWVSMRVMETSFSSIIEGDGAP